MKTSMTILGSCVTNQMIRCGCQIAMIPFLIKGAITTVNPYTVGTKPIPGIEDIIEKLELKGADMIKASCKVALQKDIKSFCRGKWILLDLGTIKNPILEFSNKDGELFYLSERPLYDTSVKNKKIIEEFAEKNGYKINRVENPLVEYSFEKQKELLKSYADSILGLYGSENIIFAKSNYIAERIRVDNTLDLNGFFVEQVNKENELSQQNQEYFIECLNCHVLEIPHNTLANDDMSLHTNGSPLHYDKNFYEYGIKALDIITDNDEAHITKDRLSELYKEYELIFDKLKMETMQHTCNRFAKLKNIISYEYSLSEYIEKHSGTYLEAIRNRYSLTGYPDIPFKSCRTLDEYMSELISKKPNYIILMAVRDTANVYWKKWKTAEKLGINADLSRGRRKSYCTVIIPENQFIREAFDDTANETTLEHIIYVEDKNITYCGASANMNKVMPYTFIASLSSKAREGESQYIWSRIMINNIDYSMNRVGANFVVFSPDDLCVVDSFYVNFLRDKNLIIRRK